MASWSSARAPTATASRATSSAPNITGTQAMGNGREGVAVYGGTGNIVGSTDPARRNVIGANAWAESTCGGDHTTGTRIIGNWIGVGADGVSRSATAGRRPVAAVLGTVVGGPGGAANRIAYNTNDGVAVLPPGRSGRDVWLRQPDLAQLDPRQRRPRHRHRQPGERRQRPGRRPTTGRTGSSTAPS